MTADSLDTMQGDSGTTSKDQKSTSTFYWVSYAEQPFNVSGALLYLCVNWKWPWCWERLRAGGEGGDRGWDGWMESLTQWTWVWANSGR